MKTDKEVSNPVANPAPPAAGCVAAGECDAPPLRLNSYYFAFETTGERAIDIVLSAVAGAAKSYHHTENWGDDSDGLSCAGRIQTAVVAAADGIVALRAQLATVTAERDALLRTRPAAQTAKLLEMGQACLDWASDTNECHFCSFDGNDPHGDDCPVGEYRALAAQPNIGEPATPVTIRRPARDIMHEVLVAMAPMYRCLHPDHNDDCDRGTAVIQSALEADRRGEP